MPKEPKHFNNQVILLYKTSYLAKIITLTYVATGTGLLVFPHFAAKKCNIWNKTLGGIKTYYTLLYTSFLSIARCGPFLLPTISLTPQVRPSMILSHKFVRPLRSLSHLQQGYRLQVFFLHFLLFANHCCYLRSCVTYKQLKQLLYK